MKAARMLFRIFCVGLLVLAVVEIALVKPARSEEGGSDSKAPETKSEPAPVAQKTVSTEAVAQELENRRLALESVKHGLDEQESRIKEREKELDKKIKEMEHLREAVSGELESQKKNNEERVGKLVAVFETMTPKAAASVFETLDDWLAVEALKRMDIKRVAKIMNIMDKSRSAKLSEMLTGFYRPENDRKISSIKNAAGQVAVAAPKADTVAQAPQSQSKQPSIAAAVPSASPQAPQNLKKKGGEK